MGNVVREEDYLDFGPVKQQDAEFYAGCQWTDDPDEEEQCQENARAAYAEEVCHLQVNMSEDNTDTTTTEFPTFGSKTKDPFVMIPYDWLPLLRYKKVTGKGKIDMVDLFILRYIKGFEHSHRACFASDRLIAHLLGQQPRSISNRLKELEAINVITVSHKKLTTVFNDNTVFRYLKVNMETIGAMLQDVDIFEKL